MNRLLIAILLVMTCIGCKSPAGKTPVSAERVQAKAAVADQALETELQILIKGGESANAELERVFETNTNETLDLEQLEKMRANARQKAEAARQEFLHFIRAHPSDVAGYAAYGDFLLGHYDEGGARTQLEKALAVDHTNPTVYNDLANIYGHRGDVKEAFNYYAKAIELEPSESVYFQNFATTVFLFRKDAREYYGIDEQQVFNKAMMLYSNAMRLDPTNYALAADVAKSYYGIKPWRFEEAMRAWTNALHLAPSDVDRQEVYTHFARIQIQAGNFERAREFLEQVRDERLAALKNRMLKNIRAKQGA